jgi:hypothetical protein
MLNVPRILNLFLLILLISLSCVSGRKAQLSGPVYIEAKVWTKVDGVVHYSDWQKYKAITLDELPGFKSQSKFRQTRYGSDPSRKLKKTGFFYATKVSDRWWIVDPEGNATLNVAINGVRPGNSSRNEEALHVKYGTEQNWAFTTHREIEKIGFNGTGCWSEVALVRYSNQQENKTPLCYTMILNFYSGFQKQVKKEHHGWPSFAVFSPEFESYVDKQAQKLTETKEDPDLLGYFSDNELSFVPGILDEYLSTPEKNDPQYLVAKDWLEKNGIEKAKINDSSREQFLGVIAGRYYEVVSRAIRKYDPHHMYLGSRLHGKPKHNPYIVRAAGKYSDILSINYYGQWEPLEKHFREWKEWADRPIIITEFYTKGDDSGMPNMSGAGWRVRTQNERGIFYENFCIKLLQMKNCVGWNWFRYMDNDPTDTTADQSNSDSNKGLVNNFYDFYQPLADHMHILNMNRYNLIRYFDN